MPNATPHLYYIHDPMCSWCWGFRPTLDEFLRRLPEEISFSRLLGGLAPDTDEPMPETMRQDLQATWRRIQERLPDTRFNFDFWRNNTPRRATYPACRAVITARSLDPQTEDAMILAIQQAYYLQARNPSDNAILIALAAETGLNSEAFEARLHAPETQRALEQEILHVRQLGIHSFPSFVLRTGDSHWPVAVDYLSPDAMLENLATILARAG
jgi:putative protein-disulfide isomerase